MSEQSTRGRREFRPVELLTGGEHINHQVHQDYDVLTYRVGHVAPYTDDNSVRMVALMLTPVGGGEPELVRERRGVTVPIATDTEVASAEAAGNRFAVANALRQVADDIVNLKLPVPRYSFTVGGVVDSRAELERWAKHLDVEIRMSGQIPVAEKEVGGLTVHFQSAPEPAAEVASDAQAVMAEAGRAMNATGDVEVYEPPADGEPQHRLAGGAAGGPGDNSAECACGVTYAGFDTHREATELIDRHIANPGPSDDEIDAEIDAAFAEPQTREIKARYLTAGMAVVSGRVREPLTVMSVLRDPDDSDFVRVVFRFVSGDTLYGVEDAVTVLADEQPATAEPQDGHVYSCCGKTGRISPHKSWCPTYKAMLAADGAQAGA